MQSLERENSFLKNEIHELTTLLNTITTSLSCKSKTTETENTLHKKSDCQEAFNKLGNVNHCTDVEDMFYNLVPLMRKKPSALILHMGTNNTVSSDSSKAFLKKNQVANIVYQNQ